MRCSEILGLRWNNVDLQNGTFDVVEQLPFHVPPKTTVIEEMAPPKSNGRRLPITDVARPYFEKQLALIAAQKVAAEKAGQLFYDNNLVVAKANGAPQVANWISSEFGKLLAGLDMPHIRFHDLRHPYVKPTTKKFYPFSKFNRRLFLCFSSGLCFCSVSRKAFNFSFSSGKRQPKLLLPCL